MIVYIFLAIILINAVVAICYKAYYKTAEFIGEYELHYTVNVFKMRHGCVTYLFQTKYNDKKLCVTISEKDYYRLLSEHLDKTAVKIRYFKLTNQYEICVLDNTFEEKDIKSILKGFLFGTITFGIFVVCVYYQL